MSYKNLKTQDKFYFFRNTLKKIKAATIISNAVIAAMLIIVIEVIVLQYNANIIGLVILAFFALIPIDLIFYLTYISSCRKKYIEKFENELVTEKIYRSYPNAKYTKNGVIANSRITKSALIDNTMLALNTGNIIETTYKDVLFEQANLVAESLKQNYHLPAALKVLTYCSIVTGSVDRVSRYGYHSYTGNFVDNRDKRSKCFNGAYLIFHCKFSSESPIYIIDKKFKYSTDFTGTFGNMHGTKQIFSPNNIFNGKYNIYCSRAKDAASFLTQPMMEKIMYLGELLGGKLLIYYFADELHVAIDFGRTPFTPSFKYVNKIEIIDKELDSDVRIAKLCIDVLKLSERAVIDNRYIYKGYYS